jgi:hypothetical protein
MQYVVSGSPYKAKNIAITGGRLHVYGNIYFSIESLQSQKRGPMDKDFRVFLVFKTLYGKTRVKLGEGYLSGNSLDFLSSVHISARENIEIIKMSPDQGLKRLLEIVFDACVQIDIDLDPDGVFIKTGVFSNGNRVFNYSTSFPWEDFKGIFATKFTVAA